MWGGPFVAVVRNTQVVAPTSLSLLTPIGSFPPVGFLQFSQSAWLPLVNYIVLPALQIVGFISCIAWFLVVGMAHHYNESEQMAGTIFWSFMIFVFIIPGVSALIILAFIMHLVNYVSMPTPFK